MRMAVDVRIVGPRLPRQSFPAWREESNLELDLCKPD
jgi:hypothetical protein